MNGRVAEPPDPGDQHPDDRDAPGPAIARHGPIDPRQDLSVARLEGPFVLLRVPVRGDPRGGQHFPIEGRIEALAAGEHVAEPPFVPTGIRFGRLADHQVGPHRPADLPEVMPTLAGRMTRHGAVDDLDRRAARPPRPLIPVPLEDRLESSLDIDAPSGPDRVAHQRDAEGPRGLLDRIGSVAHPLGVGAPLDAPLQGRVRRLQDHLAQVVDAHDQRRRVDRCREGMARAALPAEGREIAEVVESAAGVDQLLVVAPLDPRGVGLVEHAAGEAGAQPGRRASGEPVRDQAARQDREGREQLPAHHPVRIHRVLGEAGRAMPTGWGSTRATTAGRWW